MKFPITCFPLSLAYITLHPKYSPEYFTGKHQVAHPYKIGTILLLCVSYTNGKKRHKSHQSSISTMGGRGEGGKNAIKSVEE